MEAGRDKAAADSELPDVFVSYSRADQKAALPLISALEQAGYSVWWDGMLEAGEKYLRTTEAALESAKAVVVLWSKTSIGSHWVHDEAMRGRDRNILVPLSIDGSEPPLGFRQFQTIDCAGRGRRQKETTVECLLRAVSALHERQPEPRPTLPSTPFPLLTRRSVLGGAAVAVAVGAGAYWAGLLGVAAPEARSIAVLPFDNLSGDPRRDYFSDGLAAEIRGQLARNNLLQVAAQTSSNQFRDGDEDARSISRALRVAYLLDGNVRTTESSLRISAELIDGRTGFSAWSRTFDGPLADIFSIQGEIALAVGTALSAELDGADRQEVGGSQNLAAYDSLLRGKDLFDKGIDEANDRAALGHFQAAIAADPGYALAHAGRARALTVIGNQYDQGERRRATYREAIAAARRGVSLAGEVAETHSALGFALFNGRIDARAAREPYERSAVLGSGEADILSRYALYSARCGRIEAARQAIARAAALDPLNPRTLRQIGEVEFAARRWAESIPPLRRALVLNPQLSIAHSTIGAALLMLGRIDEARAEFEREPNSLFKLPGLAIIAHRERRAEEASRALVELVAEHGDNSLYQQAQVLAQAGEKDTAMARLASAAEAIDSGLIYLRNDPFVDPLRDRPEFRALLGRLGYA